MSGILGLSGQLPFQLVGTNILTGNTASPTIYQFGRAARVTFWVNILLANGSPITSVSVKLQTRYRDDFATSPFPLTSGFIDLVSDKGDKGTQQGTLEVTHVYSGLSAPIIAPGTPNRFFLDNPAGLIDVTIGVLANFAGIAGDSVTVYPVLS